MADQPPHLEDEHLNAALEEARGVVREMEQAHASSAAAAWFHSARTLLRFLEHPHVAGSP
ncbi:hypothetical protein ACIA8I_39930 [Streptomyces rishiriensis]|uniref:hypothetical protein n=1 Tax=Streptomyces rishiriensis TaxID=68264 RepID=UPI0037AA1FB4